MRKRKMPEAMTMEEAVRRLLIETLAREALIELAIKHCHKLKRRVPKIFNEELAKTKETLRVLRLLFQMTDKYPLIRPTKEDIEREAGKWQL